MYTKQDLINNLSKLNIDPKGTLMIHLSYKSIGEVEGGADTLIDTFIEYMKDGLLVIPTHTWNNIGIDKEINMDVLNTPVCIGIVPEIFRKRPNVLRSLHPTHSVGVIGKYAEEFIKGEENSKTPCGFNSVYHKLLQRNATIMLVGVNFSRNTFIHGIEEWNDIPNRINKDPHELYVIDTNGKKYSTPQYRHSPGLGSETYPILEPIAEKVGAIYRGRLGDASTIVCDARKLYDVTSKVLTVDIDALSTHEPLDMEKYREVFLNE